MASEVTRAAVVLEPAAQQFADDNADPPFLYQLDPAEGRRIVTEIQARPPFLPDADVTDLVVAGPAGPVRVRIVTPPACPVRCR